MSVEDVFEAAMSPVMTVEDGQTLGQVATQINMDLDSMVLPTADGQEYVREFDDSSGGHLGFASHNVSSRMKLMLKTISTKSGEFTWKQTFQQIAKVIDHQMNGKVDQIVQVFVSLPFKELFNGMELQKMVFQAKRSSLHQTLPISDCLFRFSRKLNSVMV